MTGPQQERLRASVQGANSGLVDTARAEWAAGARLLANVARALEDAAPNIQDQIGETGKAAAAAFRKVSAKVDTRSQQMLDAGSALLAAHGALAHAERLQATFDSHPLSEPTRPRTAPGASSPEDVKASQKYDTDKAAYDAAVADREAQARAAADHLDAVYDDSTATMKKVHGEPDRPPVPVDGGDGGGDRTGGTPSGGGRGGYVPGPGGRSDHTATTSQTTGTHHTTVHTTDDTTTGLTTTHSTAEPVDHSLPPGSSQGGTASTTGSSTPPAGTTPGAGVPGGTPAGGTTTGGPAPAAGGPTGAVGGGALGGLTGISGAVRGPLGVPTGGAGSASAAGGRALGSTARAGASGGALGRSATGT
ncbi:hypothetical protein ACT8ZV_13765, partial [Nocardioides sp. MAHUQ-72]